MRNGIYAFVAFLLLLAPGTSAHASGFKWQHFGGAPYADSRVQAMRSRESAFRRLGFPEPVVSLLVEATKTPGKKVRLVVGEHLSSMLSKGGVVHHDVTVAFVTPPISGKMEYAAPAEEWQVIWQGQTYTVILPEICNNWSAILPAIGRCYRIPMDYSATPGVVWDDQHRATVSVHIRMAETTLETLFDNSCFGVGDSTGFKKPFHRCLTCEEGEYPPADLATAVGLPPEEPEGYFSLHLKNGVGYLSLPKDDSAVEWMLFCLTVSEYPVSIDGFKDWTAVSRFDIVLPDEIQRTLPSGVLDRTLSGAKTY